MDWDCTQSWPEEELLFKTLFAQLVDYIEEQGHGNMISEILCKETGITNILKPSETITLPRKSWRVGDRSNHVQFLHTQSHVLGDLMRSIYRRLEGLDDEAPRLGSHGGVQSQEVFVVGLHGPYLHICRGFFPRDRIVRVYQHGYSDEEEFDLEYTRGYNLYLKEDWLEATRALSRLLRYLLSGKAMVAAVHREE
ncbi:hypothetical protein AtubIFM57143_006579 [Aspergillus tubingensis]|nr:hypothetical protein AtubIFM57143_006579 [Aspergillus tubingensis]